MINKKVIVGVLAVLVILTAVQGFGLKPVLADDDLDHSNGVPNYAVTVIVNGQGTVSWSGDLSGSATTEAILNVPDGSTITFTAMGATSNVTLNVDSSSMSGGSYTLTGWGSATLTDHVIVANFNQNLP